MIYIKPFSVMFCYQNWVRSAETYLFTWQGKIESLCKDIRKKWDDDSVKVGMLLYLEQGYKTEISPR